jgi:hypothetical protein
MKKDDLIILIVGLLLMAGMLFTFFFGGERSRHGVGVLLDTKPEQGISLLKKARLDSLILKPVAYLKHLRFTTPVV